MNRPSRPRTLVLRTARSDGLNGSQLGYGKEPENHEMGIIQVSRRPSPSGPANGFDPGKMVSHITAQLGEMDLFSGVGPPSLPSCEEPSLFISKGAHGIAEAFG